MPAPTDPRLPAVADLIAQLAPSVHGLSGRRGRLGVALPWREGVFIASAAAVGRERHLSAFPMDGPPLDLEVAGSDADTDVAALRLPDGHAAPAPVDRTPAAAPQVGDFVFALAHDGQAGVQASFGRLGAVGGPWRSGRGGGEMSARWRLDGGLYPGFEGALVADGQGHVLGMATSALSRVHGLVVPAATVDRVVDVLLRDGRIARPYLGVLLQPARVRVDGGEQPRTGIDGALVASLAEEGPADAGGLCVGDVVIGLDGQGVDSPQALHRALAGHAAGASVEVEIVRGGARQRLALVLGARPEPEDEGCGPRHCHGGVRGRADANETGHARQQRHAGRR